MQTPSSNPSRHLNQVELSRRWRLSPRTLERWRWEGVGPKFLKLRGRVLYRLDDIERYEAEQVRQSGLAHELAVSRSATPDPAPVLSAAG
jgi:hypothetical protein